MTVNTLTDRISYIGDGATTAFTFPFPAVNGSFIQVSITSAGSSFIASTGTYTVILNPLIAPNPTSVGGTVNYPLVGSPLAVGSMITIVRMLPATQSVSLANQSIIYPAVVEQEFDYLTMLKQSSAGDISRCFQVQPTDPPPALVPPVSARANSIAFFDSAGNLTAGGTAPSTTISAAMIPVVTAATVTLAAAAMQVAPINSPAFSGTPTAPTPAPTDNSTDVATTAFVQALVAATVGAAVFTTGDLKPTHKVTADLGWVIWTDGTIGDATSGSSIRANADTSALFALYYNSYSDSSCPLQTSTGTGTTRALQGTAAVAFAAHCRIALPVGAGRALALAGTGSGLTARTLGSIFGSEKHAQTVAEMPVHSHTFIGASSGLANSPLGSGGANGNQTFSGPDSLESLSMQNTGSGTAFTIMQPTTFINVMVKL